MKKTEEIKLMIIENFIDYFTSNEEERKAMKESAGLYVEEDHVDEITQSLPQLDERKIYNLVDTDGESVIMLVKTDMNENLLREKFELFYNKGFDYPDQFIEELTDKGFNIERVYIENYINP